MKKGRFLGVICLALILSLSGCGYTRKTILPRNIKTIFAETVKNKIPVEEVYAYQQGVEMDITNAVIRRLQVDGNLKVVEQGKADAILKMDMLAYEQEGLRFNQLESVEEYRLYIVMGLKLVDAKSGETLWEEPNFTGDTEYYVTEVTSLGEQRASLDAVDRLAHNIVDRIVEDW